jgi:hypothetical protein
MVVRAERDVVPLADDTDSALRVDAFMCRWLGERALGGDKKYPANSAGSGGALLMSTPRNPSAVFQWRCRCGLRELDLPGAAAGYVEVEVKADGG